MSEDELKEKFRSCLEFGLGAKRAQSDHLAQVVLNLEKSADAARDIAAAFPAARA